jgi:hypothetical protein
MTAPRDKIGVCILRDTTGNLVNTAKVDAAMKYMGLSMFRIRAPQYGASSWTQIYVRLARLGYRFLFTYDPDQTVAAQVAAAKKLWDLYPGCVIGFEGPNEPDLNPIAPDARLGVRSGKGTGALAVMKDLLSEQRKIWTPAQTIAVAFNDCMQKEQYPFAGYANSHIYPNGTNILPRLPAYRAQVKSMGRPGGVITEWGYHNLIGSHQAAAGISEEQAAANFAADIPALAADPTVHLAFIEMLCDGPSATKELDHFGLVRSDWSYKPAADAVRKAVLG